MKFSDRTLMILKNFTNINPSIVLRQGNIQRTMSKLGTVLAEVKIEEDIPEDVGIGNLSKFLSIISLYKNPEITFNGKFFTIESDDKKQKTVYVYDEIITIISPPQGKNIKFVETDICVSLTQDDLNSVLKAANILGLEDVAIIGDGNKISFSAVKTNDSARDVFHNFIGETDKKFKYVMKRQYLNFIPSDYIINISVSNKVRFTAGNLVYYVPVEDNKTQQ